MMSLTKSQNSLSANTTPEKRKVLLRSTCSFSIVEENIVAPTPTRKLASVPSSPIMKRREKRKPSQETLFGAAGEEIQTILFHSAEDIPRGIPKRLDFNVHQGHRDEEQGVKIPRTGAPTIQIPPPFVMETQRLSPPLRASNPITMNSPFHSEIDKNAAQIALLRQETSKPQLDKSAKRKELRNNFKAQKERFRSASWPASLNKLITSN